MNTDIVQLILDHIKVEYLILIPTLFGLGKVIKNTKLCMDEYIPVILMVLGIGFAIALGRLNGEVMVNSVIQGIIACTVTVWGNEAVTQLIKGRG